MSYLIIEEYVRSKSDSPDLCEDVIFKSDDFYAVIDGATAKSDVKINGMSSGRFLALTVQEALKELKPKSRAKAAFKTINAHIQSSLIDASYQRSDSASERPTVSIVVLSVHRQELWSLGDCQAMVDGQLYRWSKQVDHILAGYRAFITQQALAQGKSIKELQDHDVGREAIRGSLKSQFVFQNAKPAKGLAYGALDGDSNALDYLNVVDVSGANQIILASDGYPDLQESLKLSEESLRKRLKADPLMIFGEPETKGLVKGQISFDDRAFLKLEKLD